MSDPQNGRGMEQSFGMGSVRRARERAEAGLPRERFDAPTSIPRLPIRNPNNGASRPQAPPGLQSKDGNIALAISKPTPVAQWPLAGPIASPVSSEGSEPYRPPAGRSPPQRPPRPSIVPSILDGSRIQDHTPVFQYTPQNQRVSELSVPETPATSSSRPTTLSSVGSIPDFPVPLTASALPPPRRSVNLGPPPSSRRGNTSFYSTASFVSPIPEESPRSRSHASYASSAAIPDSFGTISPGLSNDGTYTDAMYFDDTIAEESVYSDDADESRLVRSASIGRKGKPSLVTTKSSNSEKGEMVPIILPIRPSPKPQQQELRSPFQDGTGFLDGSSGSSTGAESSNRLPTVGAALTTDNMLGAHDAASSVDPSSIRKAASPKPFRLSVLRRPPRLDIDAVRQAEARGSLTSLPDLIKRATRLAAMMNEGRRPASRFDDLDFPEEIYGRGREKDMARDLEKHQSGLSDMLAAFPPPAQANNTRRSIRQSVRQSTTSWPLPFTNRKSYLASPLATDRIPENITPPPQQPASRQSKTGRRCCGLPLWGFLLLMFALILVIAAAIIVPLEFFVIRKTDDATTTAQPELSDCQSQLVCANGGTNVVTDGVCSCICTNGFTGNDCTTSSSQGCTTADLSSSNTTLANVTLGQAIPRLIQQGQTNFSLPLSATTILSKFNSANLSCVAENALVTFDGQSSRTTTSAAAVLNAEVDTNVVEAAAVSVTVTILSGVAITLTLDGVATGASIVVGTLTEPLTTGTFSTIFATTLTGSTSTPTTTTTTTTVTTFPMTGSTTTTTSATSTSSTASPTSTFAVTDEARDFARVAVLFILQSETVQDAVTAQSSLQKFFTSASSTAGVTVEQARSINVGGNNTVDLVHFLVNT